MDKTNVEIIEEEFNYAKGDNESLEIFSVSRRSVTVYGVKSYPEDILRVWLNPDFDGPPDFIIVNPPIDVALSPKRVVRDPIKALANALTGGM